ncbi:MAG: hypothetical protein PHS51_08625 [Gallionella sp.]|nr:hypothetical protein [Gallionella sp.]
MPELIGQEKSCALLGSRLFKSPENRRSCAFGAVEIVRWAGFTGIFENIGEIQPENRVWIFWVTDSGLLKTFNRKKAPSKQMLGANG